MMSLFSVFDPTTYFGVSFNWLIMFMVLMFIPGEYFLIKSEYLNICMYMYMYISKIYNEVSLPNHLVLSFICVMMFLYLMMSNLMGLFPFVFTTTAHPMITMGWGVVLWLSFFLMGWVKNFRVSAAHLVPEGSPIILSPLLVMVESISHLIRPFTLSIRLAANMMAGHLIVGLLSSISLVGIFGFSCSIMLQNILLVLEFGVSIIQGFVFSILLLLYALEYY